jgi:hypothetical protein
VESAQTLPNYAAGYIMQSPQELHSRVSLLESYATLYLLRRGRFLSRFLANRHMKYSFDASTAQQILRVFLRTRRRFLLISQTDTSSTLPIVHVRGRQVVLVSRSFDTSAPGSSGLTPEFRGCRGRLGVVIGRPLAGVLYSLFLNESAVVLAKHRQLACLTPHCGMPHVWRIHRDN